MDLADAPRFLNYEEIALEVERYRYRPGWSLSVYLHPWEGPVLRVVAAVVDAYHPDNTTELRINSLIPPIPDADYLGYWLLARLIQIETHESREYLLRDGRPLVDPHDVIEPASQPSPAS